jgi:hypothetical protein
VPEINRQGAEDAKGMGTSGFLENIRGVLSLGAHGVLGGSTREHALVETRVIA